MLKGGLAAVLIMAGLGLAPAANADTFTVDTEKDLQDVAPGNGVCASSAGKCSLRAAVSESNSLAGLDGIVLPKGTFLLTLPRVDMEGVTEGDLDLLEAVTIVGKGPKKTIVRQTVEDRVFLSRALPAGILPGALIADLTITGGNVTTTLDQSGGAILVEDHLLGLANVTVRDNRLDVGSINSFGGAIAVFGAAGRVGIQESAIRNNTLQIKSETGGAVGGGVFIDGASSGSTITDTEISGNKAVVKGGGSSTGGGVYARSPVEITRADISGNQADEGGGMTLTQALESAQIYDVTISGNRAARGAGVSVSTDDPVSFTNTTISGNKVTKGTNRGGGALRSTFGDITLTHVTIADNVSGNRRAISLKPFAAGMVEVAIRGSIVTGPKKDCVGIDSIVSSELNVFGDTSCAPPGISTNLVAAPKLKPLAPVPGLFPPNLYGPTHQLKVGSPAIAFVTSGCPPPAQDQLGLPRSAGACAAGAVEPE